MLLAYMEKSEGKDNCCMTAAQQQGIYITSAQNDKEAPRVNGRRLEQAVRNTAAYKEE